MSYHIVVGGLHIESTTFTSYSPAEKDFVFKRGDELLNSYPWISKYEDTVSFTPLVHARSLPGGIVNKQFFNEWFNEFKTLLIAAKNNTIDGVLLDIHGAMVVDGLDDAEGFIANEVRKIVGDKVIISTTMDLHGNVSDLLFESTDLITCYRTAPHIDSSETRKRAFDNLIYILKTGKQNLIRAKVDVPILLPGEKTSTEQYPGKDLYAKIDDICIDKDILDCSIWMGFPWADQKRCHASIVVLGFDEAKVAYEAEKLGQHFWSLRDEFEFVGPVGDVKKSITDAMQFKDGLFFISDTGDNPGAGGSGDLNIVLKQFIDINYKQKINKKVLFASIFDKQTIEKIYKNQINDLISISLGNKTDKQFGEPLKLEVKIKYLFNDKVGGKSALVSIENIYIIITEKRIQYGKTQLYENAGIKDLNSFDIVVVKMGYLEPDLSNLAKGWIMALSSGAVNQDIENIKYYNLKRPLFPFDKHDFKPNLQPYIIKN